MGLDRICKGRAPGMIVGVLVLILLMAGGAGALSNAETVITLNVSIESETGVYKGVFNSNAITGV